MLLAIGTTFVRVVFEPHGVWILFLFYFIKVLLTGAAGQLGQALLAARPKGVQLISCSRPELDLADTAACRAVVETHRPDWVLNAGAYTAVDKAESEPELAQAVNAGAPAAFAEALAETGGQLLQVSTDFVFNGCQGSPYRPEQALDPLGVYGATKAAGETAALSLPGARVLRTSWVYGPVGKSFCLTMLRLHCLKAAAGEPLGVVAACWGAIGAGTTPSDSGPEQQPRFLHWSDAGAASWYYFAVAIGGRR